jgi:hypothetical protein
MGRMFLFAALTMVLGTVLGALQPRGELLELREQVRMLEQRTRDCERGAAGAGLREFFRAPPARGATRGDGGANEGAEPASPSPAVDTGRLGGARGAGNVGEGTEEAAEREGGPGREDIATMVAAMDARSAQARAALLEQGDLDDDEMEAIDDAIDRMNARLKQQVDAFAQSVEAGGDPDRREMMEFAAEALDAVIEADDAMVANIPESVREGMDDEALDPMSFITGETLSAIATLEGR